ncbi:hypothetical protein PRIPAC_74201 [Pristionchus pacificus]|uniref:Uncharacterized protein n=1 Tax=Pristionchus pacificus TaxID=54126 RepID=A0A2A6C183_PRIPA|nr:hypothetical protein PRIPAC_74201 [Pristionchus pacificus]|eukprot:PDM71791.1 hypothetical protein PRIPAC_38198 [Pristionchus pacificus]
MAMSTATLLALIMTFVFLVINPIMAMFNPCLDFGYYMRIPYIVFWLDITIFGLIGIIRNDSYLLMTFIVCAILGSILSCFFICNIAYLAYRKSQVQHETDDIVMWELMWIMAHVFYGVFFIALAYFYHELHIEISNKKAEKPIKQPSARFAPLPQQPVIGNSTAHAA